MGVLYLLGMSDVLNLLDALDLFDVLDLLGAVVCDQVIICPKKGTRSKVCHPTRQQNGSNGSNMLVWFKCTVCAGMVHIVCACVVQM